MKKHFPTLVISLLTSLLSLAIYGFYNKKLNGETVYVNLQEVYSKFDMKKELEDKYKSIEQARKSQMDSLELQLRLLSGRLEVKKEKIEMETFEMKRNEYLIKKKQFEEDNGALTQKYYEQILKRINTYATEYGKEKGLKFILGGDGTGSIMYADEAVNISNELVAYINNRYKGEAKAQ